MKPLNADKEFFAALMEADTEVLGRMLADDFILIDVMSGSENSKEAFLQFVNSKQLSFESIGATEQRVRICQTTAVVTGRTEMKGRLGGAPFVAQSRYTHVYVLQQNAWRLVTAQGTPITPAPRQ